MCAGNETIEKGAVLSRRGMRMFPGGSRPRHRTTGEGVAARIDGGGRSGSACCCAAAERARLVAPAKCTCAHWVLLLLSPTTDKKISIEIAVGADFLNYTLDPGQVKEVCDFLNRWWVNNG